MSVRFANLSDDKQIYLDFIFSTTTGMICFGGTIPWSWLRGFAFFYVSQSDISQARDDEYSMLVSFAVPTLHHDDSRLGAFQLSAHHAIYLQSEASISPNISSFQS